MAVKKATTTDDIKADDSAQQDAKSVKVKSPTGAVTEVPEALVDALLESGYSKSK